MPREVSVIMYVGERISHKGRQYSRAEKIAHAICVVGDSSERLKTRLESVSFIGYQRR